MKKIFFILLTIIGIIPKLHAQIVEPVHWSYAAKRTGENEAIVFFKATVDPGWHIYSANQNPGGPVKTSFAFNVSKDYALIGRVTEPTPITKYEPTSNMDVLYFEKEVVFQQKVKLKNTATAVTGKLNFMVCNDHQCLPPEDVTFSIPIN
jgi:hypothetical protein